MSYSLRDYGSGLEPRYAHSNHRGDVIAQTDTAGDLTWQASYEAFGTRTQRDFAKKQCY